MGTTKKLMLAGLVGMMLVLATLIGQVPGYDTQATRAAGSDADGLDMVSFLDALLTDKTHVGSGAIEVTTAIEGDSMLVPAGGNAAIPVSANAAGLLAADRITFVANDETEGAAPFSVDGEWTGTVFTTSPVPGGVTTSLAIQSVEQTTKIYIHALLNVISAKGVETTTLMYHSSSDRLTIEIIPSALDADGSGLPDDPFTLDAGVPWRASAPGIVYYASRLAKASFLKGTTITGGLDEITHTISANLTVTTPTMADIISAGLASAGSTGVLIVKAVDDLGTLLDIDEEDAIDWADAALGAAPGAQSPGSGFAEIAILINDAVEDEVIQLTGFGASGLSIGIEMAGLEVPPGNIAQLYSYPTVLTSDPVVIVNGATPDSWGLIDRQLIINSNGETGFFSTTSTSMSAFGVFNAGIDLTLIEPALLEVDTVTPLTLTGFFQVAAALSVEEALAAYRVYIGTAPFDLSAETPVPFFSGAKGLTTTAITAFDGVNPNQMFVTAPAFATGGPLDVQVVDVNNPGSYVLRGDLLAVASPLDFRLDSLSEASGPTAGGQSVTLTGEFLTSGAANLATVDEANAAFAVYFGVANTTDQAAFAVVGGAAVTPGAINVITPNSGGTDARTVTVTVVDLATNETTDEVVYYTYRDGAEPDALLNIAQELLEDFDNLDLNNDDLLSYDEVFGAALKILSDSAAVRAILDQIDANGDAMLSRAELMAVVAVTATGITPSEAWVFGGVIARISGTGFTDGTLIRFGDDAIGETVVAFRADPSGTSIDVIVPVSNDPGDAATFAEAVAVVDNNGNVVDALDEQTFTRIRNTVVDGVNTTAFFFDATNGASIDVALDADVAVLDVPGDSLAAAGDQIYGIARTLSVPDGTKGNTVPLEGVGTDIIDTRLATGGAGSTLGSRISAADVHDFSIYFYAPLDFSGLKGNTPANTPTLPNTPETPGDPTAGTPEEGSTFSSGRVGVGSAGQRIRVDENGDPILDANGNEIPVDPMTLSFATPGLTRADVRQGLTVWGAQTSFDYATLALTADPNGAVAYQSTLLNDEVLPVLPVGDDTGTAAVDSINMLRLFSLNSFTLRADAPVSQDVADAIVTANATPPTPRTSRLGGGVDFTIASPLGGLAWISEIRITESAKGGTGALVASITDIADRGVTEDAVTFTVPAYTDIGMMDVTIFLRSAPEVPAVTLDNYFAYEVGPVCIECIPIAIGIGLLLRLLFGTGDGRDGGGGGGGGGPCFIATAAYGTPMAAEIDTLRDVRDTFMLSNAFGTALVDGYYRVSPAIADTIAQSPMLAALVRILLAPVVFLGKMALAMPAFTALAGMSLGAAFMLRRRGRQRA